MLRWLLIVTCACGGKTATATDASVDAEVPIDAVNTKTIAYVAGDELSWYELDSSGGLTRISGMAAFRADPNFLAMFGTSLYAVTSGNRVGAYSIDLADYSLTFINDVGSGGNGPAHVAVDATGEFVFVSNYGNGAIAGYPVEAGGQLGTAVYQSNAGANAHQLVFDPSNRYVFVPCLGVDYVAQYTFDSNTGALTANQPAVVNTAAGAGPRHLAFAPLGNHAYLINELDSTMTALSLDSSGRLTPVQTLTTRAAGASGNNTTAEVVVHQTGKFVYGSNRGDDNIVAYAIDAGTGMISLVGHTSTQGMTPRSFTIDPSGRFLYAANQSSDSIVVFAIDQMTGALSPTGATVSVTSPAFVGFAQLPL